MRRRPTEDCAAARRAQRRQPVLKVAWSIICSSAAARRHGNAGSSAPGSKRLRTAIPAGLRASHRERLERLAVEDRGSTPRASRGGVRRSLVAGRSAGATGRREYVEEICDTWRGAGNLAHGRGPCAPDGARARTPFRPALYQEVTTAALVPIAGACTNVGEQLETATTAGRQRSRACWRALRAQS